MKRKGEKRADLASMNLYDAMNILYDRPVATVTRIKERKIEESKNCAPVMRVGRDEPAKRKCLARFSRLANLSLTYYASH